MSRGAVLCRRVTTWYLLTLHFNFANQTPEKMEGFNERGDKDWNAGVEADDEEVIGEEDDEIYIVLCNSSGIIGTYHSNRMLHVLYEDGGEDVLPEDLRSLLRLNRENGESRDSSLEIIKTQHFGGSNIKSQPFVEMELRALPRAIAWMGRSQSSAEANRKPLLYKFFHAMPKVFQRNAAGHRLERAEGSSS